MNARALRWVLAALIVTEMNGAFEVGMMYGILATLTREFADPVGVGWLITAFLLVGAAAAALCSRLGDLYGRRRLIVVLLVLAACGSLVSALSGELPGMIAGRALQGVSAALMPLCIGVVREHFPARRLPVAVGWLAAVAAFSAGAGILAGGWLADHASWRLTFWFSTAHAVLSLVFVMLVVPASNAQRAMGPVDWLGGVLFAPAVASILLAITRLKGSEWSDAVTVSLALAGIAMLIVWGRREWMHPAPMFDIRQFANRQVGLAMLAMTLFGVGASQLMLLILMLAQQPAWTGIGLGLTATLAATIKIPASFASLVGAPWSGHLAARHGARRAALVGSALIATSWFALLLWHGAVWQLVAMSFAATVGGAIVYAAVPNLLVEVVAVDRTSELNGMSHVVRTIGTAVGTQMVTMLLASSTAGKFPTEHAYLLAVGAVATCALLAMLVAFALPRRTAVATTTNPAATAAT